MDAADVGLRRNPPQIDEDAVAILGNPGYSAEDVERLAEEGVVAVKG